MNRARRNCSIASKRRCGNSASRAGVTILELIVSAVLFGTTVTVILPTIHLYSFEQRAAVHRRMALEEAANIMDRLTARSFDEISAESVGDVTLDDELRRQLPEPEFSIALTSPSDDAAAKHISLELSWRGRPGKREVPVRLAAWVYQQEGGR